MIKYTLRFAAEDSEGEHKVSFHAHSTAGALDVAKNSAKGDWADLYERDTLICRMQLVEESGVWLVKPAV
ncbi:hypothetical protein [Erythrobacter sp. MTPC3]|uniref:hypothetical protein n=1 Tax=Erythrobacter sp. MTPC3 TaxID=3056564 RepID=UPI0036F3A41F